MVFYMNNLSNFLSIIEVNGLDATKFLQGQLTNDINLLTLPIDNKYHFQYSAYLNPKGRMQATFFVIMVSANKYYLITTSDIVDLVLAKIKMYVMRSQVTISKLTDVHILFGANNANNDNNAYEFDSKTNLNICVQLDQSHRLFILPIGNNINIGACSTQQNTQFKYFLIQNQIPLIYTNTQNEFVPQQVNFDKINGLNFKKGCYVGQEIVARLHYLGKSKRSMYIVHSKYEITHGVNIISPILNGQVVGMVVDAVYCNDEYIGLVSIQDECLNELYLDQEYTKRICHAK